MRLTPFSPGQRANSPGNSVSTTRCFTQAACVTSSTIVSTRRCRWRRISLCPMTTCRPPALRSSGWRQRTAFRNPASAHFPKFVLHRGTHRHELRKVVGTSKRNDSGAAFLFEVPGSNSPLVLQELQIGGTSAHFPKFVLHRGAHFHELRKVMGTSKHIDSSAAFLFEVPGSNSPLVLEELQIGGTRVCTQ